MVASKLDLNTKEGIGKLASYIVSLNKTGRKALKEALIGTVAGTDDFNCLDFDRADTSSILKLLGSFVLATREICFNLFSSMQDNEEYTKEILWEGAYGSNHGRGGKHLELLKNDLFWRYYQEDMSTEGQMKRDRVSE